MATTWKSVREVRALSVALVSIDQETIQALAETHQEDINDLIVAKMKVDILKAKQWMHLPFTEFVFISNKIKYTTPSKY